MATVFEPIRPVPPITTILMADAPWSLDGFSLVLLGTPRILSQDTGRTTR
jgi:hypothetical protein